MNGVGMLALLCALVGLVLVLLNTRDRRRDRAMDAIVHACPVSWRDSLVLQVRAPLFSRGVKAVLDVSDCEPDEVWGTMDRLTRGLPADPTLSVAVSARTRDGSSLPPFTVVTGLRSSIG